ncbi:MAG: chemotaxis protein [Gammaproteobacteria bacterium]
MSELATTHDGKAEKSWKAQENSACGLVLFSVNEHQIFAIGTLKVKELVPLRSYRRVPASHPSILGMASIRGRTLPIVDLAHAVGFPAIPESELQRAFVIVTDCLRMEVGLLVRRIDRIFETSWKNISPPALGLGNEVFITGVVEFEEKMVQIMDIELVISDLFPRKSSEVKDSLIESVSHYLTDMTVLVVDDSFVARRQLTDILQRLNIPHLTADNGQDALRILLEKAHKATPIHVLVSDIEMPGLNGYELTLEVKKHSQLSNTYVILHTSLSSEISISKAESVGAEEALTKFDAEELIQAISRGAEHHFVARS